MWKKTIAEGEITYVAESDKYGIVGFSNARDSADERFVGH